MNRSKDQNSWKFDVNIHCGNMKEFLKKTQCYTAEKQIFLEGYINFSSRLANCYGLEWGTEISKWGTCEVQNNFEWGTLVGYIISFLVTSNLFEKSVLKNPFIIKRSLLAFIAFKNSI